MSLVFPSFSVHSYGVRGEVTKAKGGKKKKNKQGRRKRREGRRTDSREPDPGERAHGHAGSAPSGSRDTSKARPQRRDSLGGHGSPRTGAQSSSSSRGPCLPQRELLPRAGRAQPSRHRPSALSRGQRGLLCTRTHHGPESAPPPTGV